PVISATLTSPATVNGRRPAWRPQARTHTRSNAAAATSRATKTIAGNAVSGPAMPVAGSMSGVGAIYAAGERTRPAPTTLHGCLTSCPVGPGVLRSTLCGSPIETPTLTPPCHAELRRNEHVRLPSVGGQAHTFDVQTHVSCSPERT